ncbi:DUF2391 family protein [Halodesulfurarchaeum sp.]|uniref:DUF2391 family protein n=1 Tax=Halodesulfurarchaeum sp. TaxID=1980530 RepID=UPI001BC69754|nr:DUF2391 family protein [Halodesulfurarchaeum sp.]
MRRPRFRPADVAQQMVGGLLLAGPFVVTEEVWVLAEQMTIFHTAITILAVIVVGYSALYKADKDRDVDVEAKFLGIPLRFLSVLLVAIGSVSLLTFLLAAPKTFGATPLTTVTTVSIGSIFSVVGAAAADSIF